MGHFSQRIVGVETSKQTVGSCRSLRGLLSRARRQGAPDFGAKHANGGALQGAGQGPPWPRAASDPCGDAVFLERCAALHVAAFARLRLRLRLRLGADIPPLVRLLITNSTPPQAGRLRQHRQLHTAHPPLNPIYQIHAAAPQERLKWCRRLHIDCTQCLLESNASTDRRPIDDIRLSFSRHPLPRHFEPQSTWSCLRWTSATIPPPHQRRLVRAQAHQTTLRVERLSIDLPLSR